MSVLYVNYNSGIIFISGFRAPDFIEAFEFYSTITRVFRIYTLISIGIWLTLG